ncbi:MULTISPECIES: DUF3304 domain-containing protein [unclassified Halomonas]|uniref:DUF3304 domain-containing protein n=1 Tax=unclassified Halomonas TaxID=2609666 RepID=UPI00209E9B38|nr:MULTISPECIES: DUF3304 domain-containing protein [unclassified Halomonas]MCP1313323.1 DUF3304 domain-containing protein [Halomonas sp. 707D7]MCP1325913.1 DUF3304 domain-containing protein [Halomonas sp. 707D4]
MLVRWSISRYMRLLPSWLKFLLAGLVVMWLAWSMFFSPSKRGSLMGHNLTERPIGSFWVDGNWGGNLSAYSGGLYTGGGTTCCWSFKGDSVEVVWILSMTGEQSRQGIKEERHSVELPMPEHKREDQYLHVHFLPDNQVEFAWSPDLQSPLSEKLREEVQND